MRRRVDILGVGFDRVALVDAVAQIEQRLDRGERTFIITANPEFVMLCRDDRDILQHFLRPAAVALEFHWPGFGFHSLRREAVTAIGSAAGLGQAMNMAGHSTMDMSLLYTLEVPGYS